MPFTESIARTGRRLRGAWPWAVLLLVLALALWQSSYRLAEPAWEMDYHGRIIAEWARNAANYLRHGYLTNSLGVVTDSGWIRPEEGFTFAIDHPPVAPLLTSFSYHVFGIHEWSARLVSLVFALGCVVLIFVFVRQFLTDGWALLASTFAAGSPALIYFARLPAAHVIAVFFVLAMFLLYRCWISTENQWYWIGMWVSFVIGAWTDWVAYFAMPWLILHYVLYCPRKDRNFVFLVGSLLLPFAALLVYALWIVAITNGDAIRSLLEVLEYRSSMSLGRGGARRFTWLDFYQRSYLWIKHFLTTILCGLSVVWILSLVARGLKRRVSSDEFLVLCLLLFGLGHNLALRNRVYVHDYVMVFHLVPFFAIAGACGLRTLTHVIPGRWRGVAAVILVPIVLLAFGRESQASLLELHKTGVDPDVFLAGSHINQLVPREGKVMRSFEYDIRLLYYIDRPWRRVTTLQEFHELLKSDPGFTHYVFRPDDPKLSEDFLRHLAASYPVRNIGTYSVFDLLGSGEEILAESDPQSGTTVGARFGDDLLLLGYELEPKVVEPVSGVSGWDRHLNANADLMPLHNRTFTVTYYWQALAEMETDYQIQAEFVSENGKAGAIDQTHAPANGAYPTSLWREGDVVREEYTVNVPTDHPPLSYELRVSVVDETTGEALPASGVGTDRAVSELQVVLGSVVMQPVQEPVALKSLPEGTDRMSQRLGDGLVLSGFSLAHEHQTLDVDTVWAVDEQPSRDHAVWVELAKGEARASALLDIVPTRLWEPGGFYERRGELPLSPHLLPGTYSVNVVVGDDVERRVELGSIEVQPAGGRRRILSQSGTADGERGDVRPLDTDRELTMSFSLQRPMGLAVTAGWVGEALVEETWVEVYLANRRGERYLTTWTVPRGRYSETTVEVPAELTTEGNNWVILRVPEERKKPHYVGWRAWVDAVFPDLLFDSSGPHDGWIWVDFVTVTSEWSDEWTAYRDLASVYMDVEMYEEALELLREARGKGLRPLSLEDLNVFLDVADTLGLPEERGGIDETAREVVRQRLDVNFDDTIEVLGYSLEQRGYGEGRLELYLRCLKPMDSDYTLWLHQYDEDDAEAASLDRRLNTSRWRAGRMYQESWPVELVSDEARFVFGFWRWEDGSRLWVKGTPDQHQVDLGWVSPHEQGIVE